TESVTSGVEDPLLVVEGLHLRYPVKRGFLSRTVGHVTAIDDVSFTVNRGETVGIVGGTGSGKTSIAKCVMRLVRPSGGRIVFDGIELSTVEGDRLRTLRKRFQMIFQDPFASLTPHMKIGDVIAEPLVAQGLARDQREIKSKVSYWIERVGLRLDTASR